ncbi:hypothetical protein XpopCFBP1817_01205 [Xanthomonas populi]|uniref:Uncharacterized protein n=1 Tax=Xanthomonas populi TaxID=53414 RepID=A0A2S7F417_9XANT|nr:hypothetical protein XpopCFBP1817_01205 [Xanthomonas populi]
MLATVHADHPDWSLPAHRRGTFCGMDAGKAPALFGVCQAGCRGADVGHRESLDRYRWSCSRVPTPVSALLRSNSCQSCRA